MSILNSFWSKVDLLVWGFLYKIFRLISAWNSQCWSRFICPQRVWICFHKEPSGISEVQIIKAQKQIWDWLGTHCSCRWVDMGSSKVKSPSFESRNQTLLLRAFPEGNAWKMLGQMSLHVMRFDNSRCETYTLPTLSLAAPQLTLCFSRTLKRCRVGHMLAVAGVSVNYVASCSLSIKKFSNSCSAG